MTLHLGVECCRPTAGTGARRGEYKMNWMKLAANYTINLLTALRGCSNRGLEMGGYSIDNGCVGGSLDLSYNDPDILYCIIQEVCTVAISKL